MKTITRIFISLSLLGAFASCSTKQLVDPADATPPATNGGPQESGESASITDATIGKSKTPFRSTRMRLPDMEGLPSNQDLSPASPAETGGAVIARPPTE